MLNGVSIRVSITRATKYFLPNSTIFLVENCSEKPPGPPPPPKHIYIQLFSLQIWMNHKSDLNNYEKGRSADARKSGMPENGPK